MYKRSRVELQLVSYGVKAAGIGDARKNAEQNTVCTFQYYYDLAGPNGSQCRKKKADAKKKPSLVCKTLTFACCFSQLPELFGFNRNSSAEAGHLIISFYYSRLVDN